MTLTAILFEPGELNVSPEAAEALTAAGEKPEFYLNRHVTGDWGDLSIEEAAANTIALAIGGILVSLYRTSLGVLLSVTTEADHSASYMNLHESEALEQGRAGSMSFGRLASAMGLVLGEILVLSRSPEGLGKCLAAIEAGAHAILCSSSLTQLPRFSRSSAGRAQVW